MADIAVFPLSFRKVVLTMGAAALLDQCQCGPGFTLIVQNTDASSHTVTVAIPGTGPTGTANPDLVETVAAGEIAAIPLGNVYADGTTTPPGRAIVTYDALTGMKRAVIFRN